MGIIALVFFIVAIVVLVLAFKREQTTFSYIRDDISDYDVLKQYLTYNVNLLSKKTKKKTADFIVASYIEYFCKIHSYYIQNTYPPAKFINVFMGGNNRIGLDMIVRKILDDFKTIGVHPTLEDLYDDAFRVLGHFCDTSCDIPKLDPSKKDNYILDELCDERLVLQYAKTMKESYDA